MSNSFGATTFTSTVSVAGALSANGGIACDTDKFTVADSTGNTAIAGTLEVDGNVTLGDASTDTITCTGRLICRQVDDTGMVATAGTEGEIVYNLDDNKHYGCTGTGSPATWSAFN